MTKAQMRNLFLGRISGLSPQRILTPGKEFGFPRALVGKDEAALRSCQCLRILNTMGLVGNMAAHVIEELANRDPMIVISIRRAFQPLQDVIGEHSVASAPCSILF